MATDQGIVDALREAAEELLDRPPEKAEFERLLEVFNTTSGNVQQRARIALRTVAATSDDKRAIRESSDNMNRTMEDLKAKLDASK